MPAQELIREGSAEGAVAVTPTDPATGNGVSQAVTARRIGVDIATLEVKRVAGGVRLKITSPLLEEFFKSASNDLTRSTTIGRTAYQQYQVQDNLFADSTGTVIHQISRGSLWAEGQPLGVANFSYLRLKGIGAGITVTETGVYSDEALTDYAEKFKKFVGRFYKAHMKPFNVTIKISTTEVEYA